jgi:hypothetical protein
VTTVIGDAFVRIRPLTTGFAATTAAEVDASTSAGVAGSTLAADATAKGKQVGENLASGIETTTKKPGFFSSLFGKGSTFEAAAEGSAAGSTFAGEFGGKVSSGLGKISKLITLGMSDNPYVGAAAAAAVVIGGVGYAALKSAADMQTAEVSIANSADITVAKAKAIGKAFLGTSFQSQYSANQIATAYASVAGELGLMQGRALNQVQATKFMSVAWKLAEASGTDLGTTTSALSGFMATFKIKVDDAAGAADTLLNTSSLTGNSMDTLATQFQHTRTRLGDLIGGYQQYAALLVDAKAQGYSGTRALMMQSSGVQKLMVPVLALAKAHLDEKNALSQLAPWQQAVAKQYAEGAWSGSVLDLKMQGWSITQRNAVKAYKSANQATFTAIANQKELGVSIVDGNGKFIGWSAAIEKLRTKMLSLHGTQRLAWADAAFGAGPAQQFMAILGAGTKAYQKYNHEANQHGTVNKGASNSMSSLGGTWKMASAAFHNMFTDLGQKLMPIMTKVNTAIAHFIQHIVKDWPQIHRVFEVMWSVVSPILNAFFTAIHILWDVITDMIGVVYDLLTGKWGDAWKLAVKMVKDILPMIEKIFEDLWDYLKARIHLIEDVFSKIGPAALKELKKLPGQLLHLFMDIPKMLGAVSWGNVWNGMILAFKYVMGRLIQLWDDTAGRIPGMHINNPYANLFNGQARHIGAKGTATSAESYAMDRFMKEHTKYTDNQLQAVADAAFNKYERKTGGDKRSFMIGGTNIHITVKSGASPKEIAHEVKVAIKDHDKQLVDKIRAKGGTR